VLHSEKHSGIIRGVKSHESNYAFIDSQNLNLGIQKLGWKLDYKKFRIYLKEKYNVSVAYLFIGYIPANVLMYKGLKNAGFELVHKPITKLKDGTVKGNVDADLVLHTMIQFPNYFQAVIITSDGDFNSLVEYLREHNKLKVVLSPDVKTCSRLLKKAAKNKIIYMDKLDQKLSLKNEKAPPKD